MPHLPIITAVAMSKSIPKVIHQTYCTKTNLPAPLQENIRRIMQVNPDWEYRLYDDTDIETLILQHYGQDMLDIYQQIDPAYGAARADLFRYLLIYAEGGVYLDMKSTTTRPLNDVLLASDRYILSHWDHTKYCAWGMHPELASIERGEFQQWHVIAVAGHPFLRAAIQQVIHNIRHYEASIVGVGFKGVINTTGPIPYTLAIDAIRPFHPCRHVEIEQDLGIMYSIYDSNSVDRDKNHRHISKKHYTELNIPVITAYPNAYLLPTLATTPEYLSMR
jgi:mannosyltransferase OCH1-like enzyme